MDASLYQLDAREIMDEQPTAEDWAEYERYLDELEFAEANKELQQLANEVFTR